MTADARTTAEIAMDLSVNDLRYALSEVDYDVFRATDARLRAELRQAEFRDQVFEACRPAVAK